MRVVAILIAIAAANCMHLNDAGVSMSIAEHHSNMFVKEASPYDRCLHYVEDINRYLVDMVRLILDKKFDKLMPLAIKIAELGQLAIDCFIHKVEIKDVLSIDPNCAIDHLKKAGTMLREIVHDILHQRWHDVPEHFNQMIAILEDIKNC